MPESVQWPSKVVSSGDDLAGPIKTSLEKLNLLELDDERSVGWDTPFSKQAITAGALQATKWTGSTIASFGGVGAVIATVAAFMNSRSTLERVAFGAMAVFLIVGVGLAVAIIVHADVSARGVATAAMYRARAEIATSFLTTAEAVAVTEPAYWARSRNDHHWHPVNKFAEHGGSIYAEGPDHFQVKVSDIEDLASGPALPDR